MNRYNLLHKIIPYKNSRIVWLICVLACIFAISTFNNQLNTDLFPYLYGAFFVLIIWYVYRNYQLIAKLASKQSNEYKQVESLLFLHAVMNNEFILSLPPLRGYAASPDFLRFIFEIIRDKKPKTIVEAGSGATSTLISYLIQNQKDVRHLALESDDYYAKKTQNCLAQGADSRIIYAPITIYNINGKNWKWYDIQSLAAIDSIDLLIIDGPPYNLQALARYPALPLLYNKLHNTTMILMDDTNRQDEQIIIAEWKASYNLNVEKYPLEKGAVLLSSITSQKSND